MIPLIFIKRIPVIVAAITALIIIPYIAVLGSLLMRRLRGWPSAPSQFNLGRWGMPITVVGLVWTVIVLLDAAWPREVTNPSLGPLPVIEDLGHRHRDRRPGLVVRQPARQARSRGGGRRRARVGAVTPAR